MADIITSSKVRKEISSIWPKCYTLNTDQEFEIPSLDQFKEIIPKVLNLIHESLKHRANTIPHILVCEDICKIWAGLIILIRSSEVLDQGKKDNYSWPLGICFGDKFNAWAENHYLLIIRLKEGWKIFEPQTQEMWSPKYPDDNAQFIFM